MRWLDGITDPKYINLSKLWEIVKEREAWHAAVRGITQLNMTKQLNNNNKEGGSTEKHLKPIYGKETQR